MKNVNLKSNLLIFLFLLMSGNLYCQNYFTSPEMSIALRETTDPNSKVIVYIPKNSAIKILDNTGNYWKVEYNNQQGFVNASFIVIKNNKEDSNFKKVETIPQNNNVNEKLATTENDKKSKTERTSKNVSDTSAYWIDRTDYLITGIGFEHRNLDIIFKNNTANFLNSINSNGITDWKFTPTVNQVNLSLFTITKFGTFAYHRAINPIQSSTTKLTAFNYSYGYKKLSFSIKYLKYTGLNKFDPVTNTTTFLDNMQFVPFSFLAEYHLAGKLKNSMLYTPQKSIGAFSIGLGYSSVKVTNPDDFIPALEYVSSGATNYINEVKNMYMYQFNSKALSIPINLEYVMILYKKKSSNNPKIVYMHFGIYYLLNRQRFNYDSYSSAFNNTQFNNYQHGKGVTWSLLEKGSLVYDAGKFYFGTSANYFNYSYGYANDGTIDANLGPIPIQFKITGTSKGSGIDGNNHVEELRSTYSFFFGYRLNFAKQYEHINKLKNKILKK